MLGNLFAARFRTSNFILHASAPDIILEAGFVVAHLWPCFPLLLPFFPLAPALQSPLDIETLRFRPALRHRLPRWLFLHAPPWNTEPTSLFYQCLLITFDPPPDPLYACGSSSGEGISIFPAFFPLGSIFSRRPWGIKNLTHNKCYVNVARMTECID